VRVTSTQRHTQQHTRALQEGEGVSPTAVREVLLLRELQHEHIVALSGVHIDRAEPSLSLAFEYAEHDLYEIVWHHRDALSGVLKPDVLCTVRCVKAWCVVHCQRCVVHLCALFVCVKVLHKQGS
jgi:serine/threonine protein kinase